MECLNKEERNTNHIKEKNNKFDYFNLRKSVHQTHYKEYGNESYKERKMCVLLIFNKGPYLIKL